MKFFDCHCHTWYSPLDGLDSPDTLVRRAKELGLVGISDTDHGTLSGTREMLKAGIEHDFPVALGVEAYLSTSNDRFDRRERSKRSDGNGLYHHLILIAKNDNGLRNLQRVMSHAWTESYVNKYPIIDLKLLAGNHEDLIVTSACVSGPISKNFQLGNEDKAIWWTNELKEMFKDDFYIELQTHNNNIVPGLNEYLLKVADSNGIKPIVTTDTHFARKEDAWIEDALLILNTGVKPKFEDGKTRADSMLIADFIERYNYLYPDRQMSFQDINVFLQTGLELHQQLVQTSIDRPDLINNTLEIAGKLGW